MIEDKRRANFGGLIVSPGAAIVASGANGHQSSDNNADKARSATDPVELSTFFSTQGVGRSYPQADSTATLTLERACMIDRITIFAREESGAISVDWIVLTAGVMMLGLTAVTAVKTASTQSVSGVLSSVSVAGSH